MRDLAGELQHDERGQPVGGGVGAPPDRNLQGVEHPVGEFMQHRLGKGADNHHLLEAIVALDAGRHLLDFVDQFVADRDRSAGQVVAVLGAAGVDLHVDRAWQAQRREKFPYFLKWPAFPQPRVSPLVLSFIGGRGGFRLDVLNLDLWIGLQRRRLRRCRRRQQCLHKSAR